MIHKYTSQNARAWDEIAEIRHKRTKPANYFASGNTTLSPLLIDAAGELSGKSVLHCQCSTGEDTISWAVLGADATGVDISARQTDLAREKAKDAGVAVRFHVADVCNLPKDITRDRFDIVHTGGGSLVWIPDIEVWAKNISSALAGGGRLLLLEGHPIVGCLSVRDGELIVEDDYFSRKEPIVGTGWRHFEGGENAQETKYQFGWPLGDVITAIVSSGLRINHFSEYPSYESWRFGDKLEEARSLPGEYLLIATKEC